MSDAESTTIHTLAARVPDGVGRDATVRIGHDPALTRTLPSENPAASFEITELPRLSLGEVSGAQVGVVGRADFEILEVLGEGGMGVVYSARQHSLKRDVALKAVRADAEHPEQLAVLLHEARLTGSLEHPGIIAVHALGVDGGGRPLLVMQRVEGASWQDLLADDAHPMWARLGKPPLDRLLANLEILMQVSSTVAFAHSRGVLHRDLKPANVLIGEFGEVFVADWGVAVEKERLSGLGCMGPVGTPTFMAPELVLGEADAMDERTDVYLLGATLHALLTGRPRHEGARLVDVLFAARASVAPTYDADVPRALAELATRATSRSSADRPATALEFRDQLAEYRRHRSSLELVAVAEAALASAKAALADGHVGARARSLLLEGRFAFEHALRDWPENAAARAGMDRLLETVFEIELAERSPSAARSTLDQLSSPREDLAAKVAALEAALEEDAREREGARNLARELDPALARRRRTLFVVFLAVAGVGVTVGMRSFRLDGSAPVLRTVMLPILVGAALAPVAWWLRADLQRSAVNRSFLGIVYALLGASTVVRALAYLHQTAIEQVMTYELSLIGAAAAMLGITFNRAFFGVAALSVVCAFGAYAFPDWLEAFYVLPFVSVVAVSALARRSSPFEAASARR